MRVKGTKTEWGVSCYDIRFKYCDDVGYIEEIVDDTIEILGLKDWPSDIAIEPGIEIAVVGSNEQDYFILFGDLKKKAEQLEIIRKNEVIAICDFDFLDDVEQYEASGATVIYFNKLRKHNG